MTGEEFTQGEEGFRDLAYLDSVGKWTLGFGQHEGIGPGMTCTREQAKGWFAVAYGKAQAQAQAELGVRWLGLDEVRRAALTDMAYEMGEAGLGEFIHFLAAVRNENWGLAHDEGLASLWAKQVSTRSAKVCEMILIGKWPGEQGT